MERTLYTYFRSSAAYRVRIAMNLKGLTAQQVFIHLNRNGGEQFTDAFKTVNPQGLVPVLYDGDLTISQSLAIIEYLEEVYPQKPLMPATPGERAFVRQLSLGIACDIHPIANLRVLKFLTHEMGVSEDKKGAWINHWITLGLQALELQLARRPESDFCSGNAPGMADCCLVPQVFSAQRFNLDVSAFPTVMKVFGNCQALPAFSDAQPSRQPDAE